MTVKTKKYTQLNSKVINMIILFKIRLLVIYLWIQIEEVSGFVTS